MAWAAHLFGSLFEAEVKHFEAACQRHIGLTKKALQEAADRLDSLSQHAANIDAMLPLESDDERARDNSQLRLRAYEATKGIMGDIAHGVAGGVTLRLVMEQNPTPPLNQNNPLPVLTQNAEATQTARKEPGSQAANSGPKKEKRSGKTSKHSRASDTEPDEEVVSRTSGKRRKKEPSPARQPQPNVVEKPLNAGCGNLIHIDDVEENAFIFEYPYNTSLLWIVSCAACGFQPKRHPFIFTSNVFSHWTSKHGTAMSCQELLESHLVRVVGGNVRDATENNKKTGGENSTLALPQLPRDILI
ncbi:hypothetical protein O1611_g9114 [Lasiodiplodia mahajangana]|uniref:Uncharacterized protein n=1 Tax=Lasiodiplodia mahajangana TaxID=1108764 RepID=A0ACC2JAS3_9PEZI|nr:hypothetical protein O1611_g9114 [Lasiodiplodia mahajangana]